jgi:hypothetical protein
MDSRRFGPILVTIVAALAVLYPVTTATRAPGRASAPRVDLPPSEVGSPGSKPADENFPAAKDLVSEFLFSQQRPPATLSALAANPPYSIDMIIATVPDPVGSRLPNFFDSMVESIESAAEAAGYTLDRFAIPWTLAEQGQRDQTPAWRPSIYESVPGLILFRDPKNRKLLLVYLVGETPTTGIHKQALFSALEQIAQFYPSDPHNADLPPGFPQVSPDPGGAGSANIRVMGPSFSGSAVSLRFVLDAWSQSRRDPSNIRFQIVSGTATAIDAEWLSQAADGRTTFQATVPPDDETLLSIACYIDRLGYSKIAMLTEGNTTYGQSFTHQPPEGSGAGGPTRTGCGRGQSVPEILSLPFPMNISRVRVASKSTPAQDQNDPPTDASNSRSGRFAQERSGERQDLLPSFSKLSVQSAELTLSNLLSTISREHYSYVGIVATDIRDVTFLVREVRDHCPATALFAINSDLLYAYPDVNTATRGMMIITPYPLFNLEQLWTYGYGGGATRLQFSNQQAEGVYNATLALLHEDGRLVDYGSPLATATARGALEPALWVTAIGNGETLPVKLLEWEDHSHYIYAPASAGGTTNLGQVNVGRGIYEENSIVVLIMLSVFISAFSLLMISQYRRSAHPRAGSISALFGDTASPAYWYEGRLFLLCCCVSLLAFCVVVLVAFCLPFLTGSEMGASFQTPPTPKFAAAIAILTVVLVLYAIRTLVFAFRSAPADQRGSAPEVILFALLSCVLVFILAGFLGMKWIANVKASPASGLFNYLRAFDLMGGLSPLLPLSCVAIGACLWGWCSFRRLKLIDVLRATGTVDRPPSWLTFLAVDTPSFSGVRQIENSVKHILESSSVISWKGYALLLAVGLLGGAYFFATRLVRALEPNFFYWLFEVAYFVVYWALLMEFLRLFFTWRRLRLLLRRLSWHPLVSAVKRYRDCHANLSKVDVNHPPSSYAALESSVNQADGVVRTAKTLVHAPDIPADFRQLLQQSIPEWETDVQTAQLRLVEALRHEWADDSESESSAFWAKTGRKRATRIGGDWRRSLKSCCWAHHALFRLLQSLAKPMEGYWFSVGADSPPSPSEPAKEFFDKVEEFMVGRLVSLLALVFPSLQNLGYFVLAGLLLMLLAVTSYPFQPRNEFLFINWVVILAFAGTVFWIFIQMDRDTILSLLKDTQPGQVDFNRALVVKMFLYVAVPLLALLGAQFPESLRQILSLFTAAQASP